MATPRKKKPFKRRNIHGKADTRPVIWTPEVVQDTLNKCVKLLLNDKAELIVTSETRGGKKTENRIRTGYKFYYLGQLSLELGFSEKFFAFWDNQYSMKKVQGPEGKEVIIPGRPEICDAIERIKEILKVRTWESGIKGDGNERFLRLHLSANYGVREAAQQVVLQGAVDMNLTQKRIIEDAKKKARGL